MKKIKQLLAILGVIILAGLYLSTLFFAIFDHSGTQSLFRASIYATVIIPALIWAYSFIYKLAHKNEKDKPQGKEPKAKTRAPKADASDKSDDIDA